MRKNCSRLTRRRFSLSYVRKWPIQRKLQADATNSNFKNFQSALYMEPVSMCFTPVMSYNRLEADSKKTTTIHFMLKVAYFQP